MKIVGRIAALETALVNDVKSASYQACALMLQ